MEICRNFVSNYKLQIEFYIIKKFLFNELEQTGSGWNVSMIRHLQIASAGLNNWPDNAKD